VGGIVTIKSSAASLLFHRPMHKTRSRRFHVYITPVAYGEGLFGFSQVSIGVGVSVSLRVPCNSACGCCSPFLALGLGVGVRDRLSLDEKRPRCLGRASIAARAASTFLEFPSPLPTLLYSARIPLYLLGTQASYVLYIALVVMQWRTVKFMRFQRTWKASKLLEL
jgi:hypothetical protein